jgi:phosphoribosylformimino-5-aminoimidazole carboxamide ribotide isomerase
MIVLPAIDVLDGKAVRLRKGVRASAEVVGDPDELARMFKDAGASMVHLVDLNGAFGERRQEGIIEKVARIVPVQVGGGVRSMKAVDISLHAGATRVVVGTWAFKDQDGFATAVRVYGSKLVVAADVTETGKVAVSGWTETYPVEVVPAVKALRAAGVRTFLVTATGEDGMLRGPSIGLYLMLLRGVLDTRIIASGGVKTLDDIDTLKKMGVHEVVVGQALYKRTILLEEVKWT